MMKVSGKKDEKSTTAFGEYERQMGYEMLCFSNFVITGRQIYCRSHISTSREKQG